MTSTSINEQVYQALAAVEPNTHAVELPDDPTWPALAFEITSTPEPGWVKDGGYDQNEIVVMTFSRSREQIVSIKAAILAAISRLDGFLGDEFSGDAHYQGEADVYAYVQNFQVRTRRS